MPTDPYLPENRRFPRSRSPEGLGRDRKRRRKVLSCYDCRRRKLQCDRALPACGRCTKAGQASSCLYLEDGAEIPIAATEDTSPASAGVKQPALYGHSSRNIGGATTSRSDLLSRLEFQDGRIKQLEAALAQTGQNPKPARLPPTPESIAAGDASAPVQDRETTLLRGKGFKTQFHGNTHPGALIARIPELHGFTRDTFEQFPALSRIKEDMGSLERRVDYAGSKHGVVDDSQLRALLPPKPETDELIDLYLSTYGVLYHVLHLPSFWEDYRQLWTDVANAKAHFVALVLVMIAAVQCLTTAQPWLYSGNSSLARERAVRIIQAVDDWLLEQSQKHVSALDFQVRILLLLAKQGNARKFKRTYTEMGDFLRFCMAAGLHRTPDLIRKPTSLLEKELRKRIWATVTELELQAGFDRGLVSSPWAVQSDCPPPTHLSDDDFDAETQHMPHPRRYTDFTNCSFLCFASDSIMLRSHLNTFLNNIRQPVSFEASKSYTEEVEMYLSDIPDWIGTSSELPKAYMAIVLRQYLITLHDRQLRIATSRAERDFSRLILLENATKMLEAHQSLTKKGNCTLELLCCDQLRAALSLCHIATSNPTADDALTRSINDAADRLVPATIDMLTDKALRFGREQKQIWILLAAHGYLKSKRDPSKRLLYMQEAVDRITRPYYKIMACQEEGPTQLASATAKPGDPDMNQGVLEYYPPPPAALSSTTKAQQLGQGGEPAMGIDWEEIAAWTFEDWSFSPQELAEVFPEAPADGEASSYPAG